MTAREEILGRIALALAEDAETRHDADADPPPPAPAPQVAPSADVPALFAARLRDYGAGVTRAEDSPASIAAAVTAICARHGAHSLAVPAALPAAWIPDGLAVHRDEPPLEPRTLDALDAVLTGCAAAIAETGTIVLGGGPTQGRRALSLLPDLHLCVVRADALVATVAEGIARIEAAGGGPRRPVTLISGPSATSDIELVRVAGVHGPRRLEVIWAS
jgi:L-lactate dehydrogenase complex protein LldG